MPDSLTKIGDEVTQRSFVDDESRYALGHADLRGIREVSETTNNKGVAKFRGVPSGFTAAHVSAEGHAPADALVQVPNTPGGTLVLPNIPVTTTDTYSMTVSGAAGTSGVFDGRLVLNADVDREAHPYLTLHARQAVVSVKLDAFDEDAIAQGVPRSAGSVLCASNTVKRG